MYNFSATICSRCNNRCDKRERTDQAFRELMSREKCLLRKLAIKEQEVQNYVVSILIIFLLLLKEFQHKSLYFYNY